MGNSILTLSYRFAMRGKLYLSCRALTKGGQRKWCRTLRYGWSKTWETLGFRPGTVHLLGLAHCFGSPPRGHRFPARPP